MNVTPLSFRRKLALELDRRLQNQINHDHPLREVFWECTLRCNLHCRHCGSDCKQVAGYRDMPLQDFLGVLDSISRKCNPHEVFIVISGGEPLMRPDIVECGAEIYRRGFPWGMVSNGLALTPSLYDQLCRAGMHSITISLDGLEAEHNWMRGNPNSFRMVDQAIDLLTHSDMVFDIVTCVNRRNYSQLPAIRDYLIAKGVGAWRIFTVFPVGRAANDPDMWLTTEEFRGVFDFIRQTRREGRIRANYGCEGFLGNYEGDVRDSFYHCNAGITVGSVLVDGSISACTSIRANYHQGNIYQDDFMEVWEHRFQPYRDRTWMHKEQCAECNYFRYCQGNGMHLRDDEGRLLLCHLGRLTGER
ncbi:MAG: TIGR04133 family radical SAM/SPASM protein [Bacteroidaceae bacterium]|nr:TIGR04133 family radical SAM/SPASM protein [Bacteroidaceae bacterium]